MFSTLHFNPYNLFAASVSRWLPSANSHRPCFAVTKAQRLEFLGFSRSMMSIVSIVPLFYDQKLSQAVMTAVRTCFTRVTHFAHVTQSLVLRVSLVSRVPLVPRVSLMLHVSLVTRLTVALPNNFPRVTHFSRVRRVLLVPHPLDINPPERSFYLRFFPTLFQRLEFLPHEDFAKPSLS